MATLNFPDDPSTGDVYTDGNSGFSYEWNGTVWISKDPSTVSNIREIDNISSGFDGSDTTFTLQVAGVNVEPANVQQLIISVGGVMQNAGQDFTLSGSTLTFTTAPTSGLTFFGVLLGTALSLNTVADGSVGAASFAQPLTIGAAADSTTIPGNAVVSGILTAANAYVSGILTAKTLNYDNVTDIYSTGIITAKGGIQQTGNEGLHVSAGITTVGIFTATKAVIGLGVTVNNTGIDAGNIGIVTAGTISAPSTMELQTGGVQRVHVGNNGLVGIRTDSSLSKALTIKTVDGYEASIRLEGPNGADKRLDLLVSDSGIGTISAEQSSQQLSFRTAGGEAIRIDAAGEVGINTTSPNEMLTIYQDSSVTGDFGIRLQHENNTTGCGILNDGAGLKFQNYNSSRRFAFVTGKVGIGTTTPGSALQVQGKSTLLGVGEAALEWGDTSALGSLSWTATAGNPIVRANSNKDLVFQTNGANERLRITANNGFSFNNGELVERVNITAGKLSNNTNIDLDTGMVHYFTTQESTTSTPNIRINSSTTLNSVMDTGDVITVTLITTAAAAGYSANLTIDGSAVTEEWVGGAAPSAGSGDNGLDIYTYTIIKTGSGAYTVIANLTYATN